MPYEDLILTIGKVAIAAAWADGEITQEEKNALKDLMFHLPGLTAHQWASLDMYIESPVEDTERQQLVEELQGKLSSPEDKALAISAVDEMIRADGSVDEEERAVAEEIKAAIRSANVGFASQFGRFLRGSAKRHTGSIASAREASYQDFVENKVYFLLQRQVDSGRTQIDLPEEELRKLSLAGGLMAWVAQIDRDVSEGEVEHIQRALQVVWDLSPEAADFVVDVAVSVAKEELDYFRLTRTFFELTTPQERLRFVDALFAVANADGFVSYDETEQIRLVANSLKLTHRQFIDAKLKIPREQRSS